jgi:signal transduction histidine kinase
MVLIWSVVAAICAATMVAVPGSETVPYHVAWATFALCFGLEQWSRRSTSIGLGVFTVVTGAIIVDRAATGVLDWQETAEIPLMLLLMALMIWHVRRRQQALSDLTANAARERAESTMRELLTLRTSHEMRSPLMISRGYLELLIDRTPPGEDLADLRVVDEELARLTRVCERLVRSMRVGADLEVSTVDLDAVLRQTAERWSAVARRDWRVESTGGTLLGSSERLRACLDTLVENALRYTDDAHDTVLLYARQNGEGLAIGVADSGRGFNPEVLRVAQGHDSTSADRTGPVLDGVRDDLSQTGLGLSLVRDVATRRGGWVQLGVSPWGGADVAIVVPAHPRAPADPAATPTIRSFVQPGRVPAPAAWSGGEGADLDVGALERRAHRPRHGDGSRGVTVDAHRLGADLDLGAVHRGDDALPGETDDTRRDLSGVVEHGSRLPAGHEPAVGAVAPVGVRLGDGAQAGLGGEREHPASRQPEER